LIVALGFGAVTARAQEVPADCNSAIGSGSPSCTQTVDNSAQQETVRPTTTIGQTGSSQSSQVYVDSAGVLRNRVDQKPTVPTVFPRDPITDFQRLARMSTGQMLPIFGRDFFERSPSTFAPSDQIAGQSDYVLGPGDEVLLRLWGPESINSQLTVDASGAIYIPKVGAVHVAGLRYDQLQNALSAEINRIYRNYRFSVSLGQLRSIQIYIVGDARRPGAYTVSSLSTVLNALFISGGPNVEGSLRHIQVRRGSETLPEFDLYDLVLRGDKSKDVRLEAGDTIYIPAVGSQVALAGSVRHPAIYELNRETNVGDLLQLAGGLSSTALRGEVRVERIDADQVRKAMTVALDATGREMPLRDGDVLFVNHISAAYEQSVTIRGNLANPGRFAWHPGMHLSDIIPDRISLLTNDYWRARDQLGVPVPLFEPMPEYRIRQGSGQRVAPSTNQSDAGQAASQLSLGGLSQAVEQHETGSTQPQFLGSQQGLSSQQQSLAYQQETSGDQRQVVTDEYGTADTTSRVGNLTQTGVLPEQDLESNEQGVKNRITIPAAEIDWSYAVIERLDPETLKSSLVPFNLGKLVMDHDASQNLELHAGDVVTILSQNDVQTPQDSQTKYIHLEGEFVSAGVYSVEPNETLEDVVARAGGLTSKAYLYGSSFTRESARVFQQQRLDEYISSLSADFERASGVRAASAGTGILDPNALSQQRALVTQLRQLRATGRVVLEFRADSAGTESIPKLPLENGDVFRVPTRPNTISVVGAVYGQNVFLYSPKRKLEDYVSLAGNPNRYADTKRTFIIRADGSIYSRERAQHFLSNDFESAPIYPGDAIVVPEKPIRPSTTRTLLDYSQILSGFGLAAAAIQVVK
jgi:protein involved in polysaccharide export with SLBB domain